MHGARRPQPGVMPPWMRKTGLRTNASSGRRCRFAWRTKNDGTQVPRASTMCCAAARGFWCWMFAPHPLLYAPAMGGFCGIRSRNCLSAASSSDSPAKPTQRRLLAVLLRVANSGVAFLLGTFLWRSKEKYLARRGETRLRNFNYLTRVPSHAAPTINTPASATGQVKARPLTHSSREVDSSGVR